MSAASLHAVFIPEDRRFFFWGEGARGATMAAGGVEATARVVGESLRVSEARGVALPLADGLARLARLSGAELAAAPASIAAWSAASKLALELVARERLVPRWIRDEGGGERPAGDDQNSA